MMCQIWNYWTASLNPNSSPSIFDEFVEALTTQLVWSFVFAMTGKLHPQTPTTLTFCHFLRIQFNSKAMAT